ncbi:hypothetical protein J4407_02040 [Candidatus Pacearchaeota archaeon]|nr:hypothetical protein [Candidatus Pacearchaeota archaeon]
MKISDKKRDKIAEQILALLFSSHKPMFTSHVAEEIARDEEFIKKILEDLKKRKLVIEIKKNPKGVEYIKRSRWRLSDSAYKIYKQHQANKFL